MKNNIFIGPTLFSLDVNGTTVLSFKYFPDANRAALDDLPGFSILEAARDVLELRLEAEAAPWYVATDELDAAIAVVETVATVVGGVCTPLAEYHHRRGEKPRCIDNSRPE
jgi:hypothetical protein